MSETRGILKSREERLSELNAQLIAVINRRASYNQKRYEVTHETEPLKSIEIMTTYDARKADSTQYRNLSHFPVLFTHSVGKITLGQISDTLKGWQLEQEIEYRRVVAYLNKLAAHREEMSRLFLRTLKILIKRPNYDRTRKTINVDFTERYKRQRILSEKSIGSDARDNCQNNEYQQTERSGNAITDFVAGASSATREQYNSSESIVCSISKQHEELSASIRSTRASVSTRINTLNDYRNSLESTSRSIGAITQLAQQQDERFVSITNRIVDSLDSIRDNIRISNKKKSMSQQQAIHTDENKNDQLDFKK